LLFYCHTYFGDSSCSFLGSLAITSKNKSFFPLIIDKDGNYSRCLTVVALTAWPVWKYINLAFQVVIASLAIMRKNKCLPFIYTETIVNVVSLSITSIRKSCFPFLIYRYESYSSCNFLGSLAIMRISKNCILSSINMAATVAGVSLAPLPLQE
jgi:hypothetical protein